MQFTSPNFAFLATHDQVLVRFAALAERYVFDDPNSALVKLRQFAESLAEHCAAYTGIQLSDRDKFIDVLDRLYQARITPGVVLQLFHGLRKAGNKAAHDNLNERREALHQLQMAWKLSVWFHKTFHNSTFQPGAFVPPPNPVDTESELREQLDRLRAKLAEAKEAVEGSRATAQEQAAMRAEADAAARTAYDDLNAALELAAESEQQFEQQRAEFQQRLEEIQQANASKSEDAVASIAQAAGQAGSELDLDESATRRIIDGQLREAGWKVDSESIRHGKGSRPVKGQNLAIAEWPTAHGPADYVLFTGLTPVAVVEAKRKTVDVAGAIEQAKRYSRDFQVDQNVQSPGGPWQEYKIPFLFSTNGRPFLRQLQEQSGIWFHDARRSTNHSRVIEDWYTPEGLTQLLSQDIELADQRLTSEPMDYLPLRDYQQDAVRAVEHGIASGRRELLVAMATGTGKTITCIGLIYRLIKAGRFRRVLFLVDRSALGEQAFDKLQDVRIENQLTFPEIYDVKQLGDLRPDSDTRMQIATVQGMVRRVLFAGEENVAPLPVDAYDCIVVNGSSVRAATAEHPASRLQRQTHRRMACQQPRRRTRHRTPNTHPKRTRQRWEQDQLAKHEAKGKKPPKGWKEKYAEPSLGQLRLGIQAQLDVCRDADWQFAPLDLLVDPNRGIPYGIVKTGDETANGIPTIRCGDIKGFGVNVEQLRRVDPKIHAQYRRTWLVGGEVVIAIRGTVGQTAVVPETMEGMNISREVALIPLLPEVDSVFIMYLLASPLVQRVISSQVKGVAQAGINLSDLRVLSIPLPPLAEQVEIAKRIAVAMNVLQVTRNILDQSHTAVAELDQSILAKAFRGELVPQDTNDEPACVLLERIRQQRESEAASKKKKKRSKRNG